MTIVNKSNERIDSFKKDPHQIILNLEKVIENAEK